MNVRKISMFCVAAFAMFTLSTSVMLQAQDQIGPSIGDKVDDFVLMDQSGSEFKFAKALESGPVAVVFHRSAGW